MMVRLEDVPLKPIAKWKRNKRNYETVDDNDSSNEEDSFYLSDGYVSLDSDDEEIRRREYRYRRQRWHSCKSWCLRFV